MFSMDVFLEKFWFIFSWSMCLRTLRVGAEGRGAGRWRTSASSGTASWTSSCPSSGERIYVKLMSEKCVLGQTNKTITSQDEICGNFLHLKSILLQARKPANKSHSGHIYRLLFISKYHRPKYVSSIDYNYGFFPFLRKNWRFQQSFFSCENHLPTFL